MLDSSFPANFTSSPDQQGFIGGAELGYVSHFMQTYYWGADISVLGVTGSAATQNASTQISETSSTRLNIDLDAIAGLQINNTNSVFMKLGPSTSYIKDSISSPQGLSPSYANSSANKFVFGVNFGLGYAHNITDATFIFSEYDYRYYPEANFQNFTNYTSNYSHSIESSSNSLTVGLGTTF